MMRRLQLVPTPTTASATAPATPAGDRSRTRHTYHPDALRGAWLDGQSVGLRVGYTQGWRYGLVCGVLGLVGIGALCVALYTLASGAGWLPW